MQASRFERLLFDPFPLFQNGFVTPEADICGCDVAQALVVALVVVVIDKGFDLGFEIAGQELVFQQDAVLQSLMPPVNFSLSLGMIWRTARMLHTSALRPFRQITKDVA